MEHFSIICYDKMTEPLITRDNSVIVRVEKHENNEVFCGLFCLNKFIEVLPCIYSKISLVSPAAIKVEKKCGHSENIKVKSIIPKK